MGAGSLPVLSSVSHISLTGIFSPHSVDPQVLPSEMGISGKHLQCFMPGNCLDFHDV